MLPIVSLMLPIVMALGADASAVTMMVMRQALMPVAAGLGVGLTATSWLTRIIESSLFGVSPHDPATLATASLVLVATAATAVYVPASRASRVDPIEALRAE